MRLDRWFRRRYPGTPQSHLNKIVRKGEIRVEGKRVEISTRLEAGQHVRVPPLGSARGRSRTSLRPPIPPMRQLLRSLILFEDRDVIVFNKPYGLAVQGGSGTKRHIDGMLAALADKHGERPVLVHRLDRDTSGVLLCAKSRKMAAELGAAFRAREKRKRPIGRWSKACLGPENGRISLFLAKGEGMGDERGEKPKDHADKERMRVVKHGDPDAQHSVTLYATVDQVRPRLAWLSLRPITGRTHQLRAHCEAIGHPIIGDPKYNRRPANDPARHDPLRAVPPGDGEQAASVGATADPAASARRAHRCDRALAAAHEGRVRHVWISASPSRDPIEDAPDA